MWKIEEESKLNELLSGKIVSFSLEELNKILKNQSLFNINTLLIQSCLDGQYYCRVDNLTKMNNEK